MLWMLTDPAQTPTADALYGSIARMCEAGVDKVTLRGVEEVFGQKQLLNLAATLSTAFPEVSFFIVENTAIAEMAGIHHIHLRSISQGLVPALKEAESGWIVSVSTHSVEEWRHAFASGADFALFSPVFRPISKPGDTRQCVVPVRKKGLFLLGGIDAAKAKILITQGFTNLAGISLFYGEDAVKEVKELKRLINEVANDQDDAD